MHKGNVQPHRAAEPITRGDAVVKRIGMGLVGAGFIGPHHVDAVRRLGYVDVVAVAGSNEASAQKKAAELGIPKGYGSYEALLADPGVEVIEALYASSRTGQPVDVRP